MIEEKNTKRLLVMAGGTGGHIFPALAVANVLRDKGWEIRWLGTADRMEADLVPKNAIDINFIDVKGLRGSGIMRKITAPWMMLKAIYQARGYINDFKPNAVLGMGGYVSGPGGVAAYLYGAPLVLHEQNAVAGLTNRLLAKMATRVLQAFPHAFEGAEVVGNPVREVFCQLAPHRDYQDGEPLNILITGGSQGAQILNRIVPEALALLSRDIQVRHQAGKGNQSATLTAYQGRGDKVEVTEFIDDIASHYAWADIVICRSGALTVSEIAACGVAAIFIPFQHQDRQQALNADFLVAENAALMIEQQDLSIERLATTLAALDASQINTMAHNARALAKTNAATLVADAIEAVAV